MKLSVSLLCWSYLGLVAQRTLMLLDIFKACGVALPQFLFRVITIIVGLIVFFRECRAALIVECL
ncbi:hypothetical protein IEQ34_004467 [Dendrobium chrysotoxum]|uniref:Secreted protein n=1 Tax=Dendrobium chrysotoxum TaxID=161865 RepID=A0AAV7HGM2_DENCH|nr:hypothetical protein IEQ34_004467 [Dendrobium chrysotoxum]